MGITRPGARVRSGTASVFKSMTSPAERNPVDGRIGWLLNTNPKVSTNLTDSAVTGVFMDTQQVTLKYMEKFNCIGSECEMNCCHGWSVALTDGETRTIQDALERYPTLPQSVDQVIAHRNSKCYLQMSPEGLCTFQEDSGLCALQSAAGEEALPQVCANYPRVIQQVGARVELSAKTSCPELARILLLEPDATTRVSCDKGLIPRQKSHFTIADPKAAPWTLYLDEIRDLFCEYLRLPYPLAHRLYLLTVLADRITPILNAATSTDPRASLQRVLAPLLQRNNLDASNQHLTSLNWDAGEAFPIALNVLTLRAATSTRPAKTRAQVLVSQIYINDGLDIAAIEEAAATLWPRHQKRAQQLREQAGDRVEQYGERFAEHYLFHEMFPMYKDLNSYVCRLLLLLSAQRILMVNNPELAKLLDNDQQVGQERIDQAAVRALYCATRIMEHNPQLPTIQTALEPKSALPLVQRLCFI